MFDEIDPVKMLEQEPELKEYFKDVIYQVMIADNGVRDMVSSVVNFRNIGMTTEQVAEWIKGMQRFQKPPEEEE